MAQEQTAGADEPLTQPIVDELDRALAEAAEREGISLDDVDTPASGAGPQVTGEGSNDATANDGADANASATETTEATKSGTQAAPKEKGARASAEGKGEEEPKDSVTEANEAAEDEAKLSPYAKRQRQMEKERKRLSESWKQLEAEKAEVRRLREEQERRLAQASQSGRSEYSPEDYETFARKAEEEGDYELAETAKAEAARLRAEAQQQAQPDRRALEQAQALEYQKARAEIPELQDPKSPMATQVVDMLRRTPDLLKYPNGPALAARYVAAQARAARVPELEATVEKLKTKIAELEASTSVGGGSTGRVNMDEPPFESLSPEQQREQIMRELAGR